MKYLVRIALVAGLVVLSASCKKDWDGNGEEVKSKITVDGFKRTYRVYTPENYNSSQTYPLVFVLHGRFGNGKNVDKFTIFDHAADANQMIAVYPDGYKRSWVDDRNAGPAAEKGVNDINFFNQLLDRLIADYPVDEERVYACGMSNGGFMSFSMACHMSDRIAAVAGVTGNMTPGADVYCADAAPTGVLLIGGVDDDISPYEGGTISSNTEAMGFPATFDFWVNKNNCIDAVQDSVWADLDPNDGTTVITHSHFNCDSSVQTILYEIQGMGHTWPSGNRAFKEKTTGVQSLEINASMVIAEFLLQHTLN